MNRMITALVRAGMGLMLLACAQTANAAPVTCRIGAYITSLHDIDTVRGTFAADAWLWSQCPDEQVQALTTAEATNANAVAMSLHSSTPRPGGAWEQQKLTGTFRHDYDVRLFPFDRHRLVIRLEEGVLDTGAVRYVFDAANSGISPDVRIDGWRVSGFRGLSGARVYRTSFGDPALPAGAQTRYADLDLTMELSRHNISSFFKLAVPVYVAAMLALLSLLMFAEEGRNVINPRIALLAGLLFSVVLNLRSMNDVIGSTPSLTLMDLVHFVALALIVMATLAALAAGRALERGGQLAAVKRLDRRLLWWSGSAYVVINVALLVWAVFLS